MAGISCCKTLFGLILMVVVIVAISEDVEARRKERKRVLVPKTLSWANLAWGWKKGGIDATEGMKAVIIDIDEDPAKFNKLKADGHILICYFSAGTIEPWRSDCANNKKAWEAAAAGPMADWDEAWLDVRKLSALKALMSPRIKRAKAQGCHAIEPDNTDCYDNEDCWGAMTRPTVSSGKNVKAAQLSYNKWFAKRCHSKGLAVALKNTMALIPDLHSHFDFAINEQCVKFKECSEYSKFTNADKAVFHVEYSSSSSNCDVDSSYGLQTKYCAGSNSKGLCTSGSWIDCFSPVVPLPPTIYSSTN